MGDWEEIKRLAADFQKLQLSTSSQKLSERNIVEIVSWLIKNKKIDLIFTSDGKEYITSNQLINDIKSELYVSGGRVNLVELAKLIGVDFNHVNAHVPEVLKGQKDVHSVLGQLIDNSYIVKIAGEINEKLQQVGQINVSELTIQYDLPAEFLQSQVLGKHLGKIIHAKQDKNDPKVYFTESFIARSVAKMRGALNGLTQPTAVSAILNLIDVQDKLFFTLFDQSSPSGFLTNKLSGAQYIPNIYSKSQNEWVNNFYKQNGYLEFDALTRLGISDYKSYLKNKLNNDEVIYLKTCVVSKSFILDRIEADVEECISSKSYLDVRSNLPSILSDEDVDVVLETILTPQKQRQTVVINDHVFSKQFLDSLFDLTKTTIEDAAKRFVQYGQYVKYKTDCLLQSSANIVKTQQQKGNKTESEEISKRDERRKKAMGGKLGGGAQGRETKTKSTKKANRSAKYENRDSSPDQREEKTKPEIVTYGEIKASIIKTIERENLDQLLDPIVLNLQERVNEAAYKLAETIYASADTNEEKNGRGKNKKKSHQEVQERINVLTNEIRLYEKGIKLFEADAQQSLIKYLFKIRCAEILDEILNYVACDLNLTAVPSTDTNENRLKFINELPNEYKVKLTDLFNVFTKGKSVEEFTALGATLEEALACCGMILKKVDKKKDRITVLNYVKGIEDELETCTEPPEVLRLALLLVFYAQSQCMLHASGRHAAAIMKFLKPHLTQEQFQTISNYHDLVTLVLNKGSMAEEALEQLKNDMKTLKTLAVELLEKNKLSKKSV